MYGVVVCPRCRRAKGVDLSQKTTACACGFEIRVAPSRIRARTETARDLRGLVARANAELGGGLAEVREATRVRPPRRPRGPHARVVAASARAGDRVRRIRAAAIELTKELEVFTDDDWRRVLEGLDIPDPDAALQELLGSNAIYEPRPGFYRAVSLAR